MLDRRGNSNSSLLTIAHYYMIQIKTHHQLLYEHVLQPFTVVLHDGISANTSKVKIAFIMYLTYLKTEQIFFGGGGGDWDHVYCRYCRRNVDRVSAEYRSIFR